MLANVVTVVVFFIVIGVIVVFFTVIFVIVVFFSVRVFNIVFFTVIAVFITILIAVFRNWKYQVEIRVK